MAENFTVLEVLQPLASNYILNVRNLTITADQLDFAFKLLTHPKLSYKFKFRVYAVLCCDFMPFKKMDSTTEIQNLHMLYCIEALKVKCKDASLGLF